MIIKGERKALERKAAWILAETIQQIGQTKSRVVIAVPGGASVVPVLAHLRHEPVDWEKVHIFMTDERLVPLDHPESNFRQTCSLLQECISSRQLHPYIHDSAAAEEALSCYRRLFLEYGGSFDVVLLSGGEDGHVASLFPRHETIDSPANLFLLTACAPKPPPARMTASRSLLGRSAAALLLLLGPEKHAAASAYLDEAVSVRSCPAKIVKAVPEHFVLTDWQPNIPI